MKIRGFRIELGEIEQTLRQQPGIREAVVVARNEASGDEPARGLCDDREAGRDL